VPNLPSTAQITALRQPHSSGERTIVHILHYPLTRRAPDLDIIEEPGLLENVEVRLRLPARPARVALVPKTGRSLRLQGRLRRCHRPRRPRPPGAGLQLRFPAAIG